MSALAGSPNPRNHLLPENRRLCYSAGSENTKPPQLSAESGRVGWAKEIFIWIRYNSLKSPESAKGIQGNPSLFIWICLDFLGE
jgi:hypothetical protein